MLGEHEYGDMPIDAVDEILELAEGIDPLQAIAELDRLALMQPALAEKAYLARVFFERRVRS